MHSMTLYIINTNSPSCPYTKRCDLARRPVTTITAAAWTKIVVDGIREYQREIGQDSIGGQLSTGERLRVAAELADYYEAHVAEVREASVVRRHQARRAETAAAVEFHGERINARAKANSPW
jgi:hypothetical protein